jgi:hypothetical protein
MGPVRWLLWIAAVALLGGCAGAAAAGPGPGGDDPAGRPGAGHRDDTRSGIAE